MGKAAVPCRWELWRGTPGEEPGPQEGTYAVGEALSLLKERCGDRFTRHCTESPNLRELVVIASVGARR